MSYGAFLPPKVRAAIVAFDGTHVDAAKKYGVSVTTASRIRRGEGVTGRKNTAYTDADIERMSAMRAAKKTARQIAEALGKPLDSVTWKLNSLAAFARPKPVVVAPWVARALHAYRKQGFNC